jgi:DNA-binding transcriptional MerR regulator
MVARGMSTRSYLSIGDVLSLLREEFPDVTISKIRFLESQGLVDPERSPSGYRKFYEEDVARLRWVLRKQRDQFLPLKVIRDRLAAAGNGVPPDDEPVENGEPGWHAGADLAEASVPLREEAHAVVGAGGRARNGTADATGEAPWPAGGDEDEDDEEEDLGDVRPGVAATATVASTVASRVAAPKADLRAASRSADVAAAGTAGSERRTGARAASSPTPAPPGSPEAESGTGSRARPAAAAASTQPTGPAAVTGAGAAGVLSPSVSGVSLTLAELCAATGLTPDAVASLQGLGLLSQMSIAGGTFYDEEALTVGKLVVEFGRYGVEPRHLRMYRNAVEREVGLVEQVITPLLRQRNPEARQRAVDAAADLARLGQSMRASLIRSELRRQLGV